MRQCSRRAPTGIRNRAIIAVLWRCGPRIREARGLAVKDFDPDSGTLVVQRGKGGKRRVVGVDAGTIALIRRWLEVRRRRSIPGGAAPLFCSLAGRPLDLSYVRHLLPRLARKAGIERRVHAHALTPSPSTSSAPAPRSTSSATRSATRASRRRTST